MYRKRKSIKNIKNKEVTAPKTNLNTIDEDTTIKIPRVTLPSEIVQDANEAQSSEENIPESQEQTQRFLSQRSVLASTLGRTQSRSNCSRPPNTYFELVLMKSGVQLDEADNFILSCDHVAFVGKLRDILLCAQNYPENIDTFKTGLNNALAVNSKLSHKLLTGCVINAPDEECTYQSQNSMFVNFLMIDFLRDASVEVLLDRIEELVANKENKTSNNILLLPLMLTQLFYVASTHTEQIYERIERVFCEASEAAKMDIISNAEFILNASKHDKFAELLIENYSQSSDLFQVTTLQTLTNLSLSIGIQTKLRARILAFIKENQCPTNIFSHFIKFLLKNLSEENDDSIRELVLTIREIFNWRSQSFNHVVNSTKQSEVELFNFIKQGLIRSKRFYYNWQKVIAGLPDTQFKSFDFIMLLLFMHIKEDNSLYIENILRRRIKLEHITVNILDDIKKNYLHILEMYINILLQIIHDFMREKNKIVADFAKSAYSILFKIGDNTQKQLLRKLVEFTSDKTAQHMINTALQLLIDLKRKHPQEIQNYGLTLMPLLDRLNEMNLSQARLVMQLLCSIAFPSHDLTGCPTLQDQIDMIVKKQLINRLTFIKRQGIISSVQLIDSIVRIDDLDARTDDLETTYDTISALPDGRNKLAANFFMRTQTATLNCAESLALFYDEMAVVCSNPPYRYKNEELMFDAPFLIWLSELVMFYFQDNFIVEHEPAVINGIKLEYKMCLNTDVDANTNSEAEVLNIGINIAQLTLKPTGHADSSILVLAPLFNLMSALHMQRYELSLECINALLGCSIVLPIFFDELTPDALYFDYDIEQQKLILDIYFHTVNWIRASISAFATQTDTRTSKKVLQRLANLIEIEQKIRQLLVRAPLDYQPPVCQFLNNTIANTVIGVKSTRSKPPTAMSKTFANRGKSKQNQTETENLTPNDTAAINQTRAGDITTKLAATNVKAQSDKINFEHLYGSREVYRQLEPGIMLLLQNEINMKYPLEKHEIGEYFGLQEFRFVLTDLVHKLESILDVQKSSNTDEYVQQYMARPVYFISDLMRFFRHIQKNMDMISTAIIKQLELADYVYSNGDLFTEEFNYLKVCFGLCIRLFTDYYSWPQFTDETRKELLKESLLAFLPEDMRSKGIPYQAAAVFEYFIKYEKSVLTLKTAVYLKRFLQVLRRLTNAGDAENQAKAKQQALDIRSLCCTFVQRKWYHYDGTSEKGAECNILLDELIKDFLSNSDFKRQRDIYRVVHEECTQLNAKDGALKSFPNVKKSNFPLLFRGFCDVLICRLSYDLNTNNLMEAENKLPIWEQSCKLLNMLLEIVKNVEQPRNFLLFLKHSHLYLKLMLQHGLPVLETYLRQNPERVSLLLKSLQEVTRFLHNLCCHSKAIKHLTIINQIPFLRETVENFVFRVKALLAANKCHNVFWMGNLINKDLHGDTIVTPANTYTSAADETGSESELPDDDQSVDETVLDTLAATRCEITMDDNHTATKSANSLVERNKSRSRSECY